MSRLVYPVACWPLAQGAVLARVLGAGLEVVGDEWRDAEGQLKRELSRRLLDPLAFDFLVDPVMREPQEKRYTVKVRPAYSTARGWLPAPTPLALPITAIVGVRDSEGHVCFLPQINEEIHLCSLTSLQALVKHFVLTALQERTPEDVHGLLQAGPPWLETVEIPEPPNRIRRVPKSLESRFPRASAVAEPFPPPRGVRRSLRGDPGRAWERGEAVEEVRRALFQDRASLLLVGESGVGKTVILSEAIRGFRPKDSPRSGPAAWRTTARRLVAGAKYLGDWQELVDKLLKELKGHRESVLWIDDVVNLLALGGDGPEDSVAAYLWPAIRAGDLRIAGELNPQELDAARSLLPGFVDSCRLLPIQPLGRPQVLRVLGRFREFFAQNRKVNVEPEALNAAYRLSERFQRGEAFPGKTLSILMRCVNEAQLDGREAVALRDVLDSVVQTSGLPEMLLRDDIPLDPEDVVSRLREDVLGQDEAVREVARIAIAFKTGLNDPDKPVATLLFAGPTGVGKTALARSLARFFFGAGQKKDPLVRVDMSELQHPAQMERLIGTPREPGSLVQRIRERPFSVLLLDEIEKAHPAFFDTLLTVLDEGLLFDALGRPTDFRNAIIIMTSNLGAGSGSSLGFLKPEEHAARTSAIREFFRPEFLNRIDRIITFRPLGREVVEGIARKELKEIGSREGLVRAGVLLELTHRLVAWVGREGFDERYGARRLQRLIEQRVVAALSHFLLDNPELEDAILEVDWVPAGPDVDGGRDGGGRVEVRVMG